MGYNKEYETYRPTDAKRGEFMHKNKLEQRAKCKYIQAENRFLEKLMVLKKEYKLRFRRQYCRGTRIFDFFCHDLGIAIEIDGGYHKTREEKDIKYDKYNFDCHGILVIRVENYNEGQAYEAIQTIRNSESRWERRKAMGIKYNQKKYDQIMEKKKQDNCGFAKLFNQVSQ